MPLQCGTWKKRFFAVTGPIVDRLEQDVEARVAGHLSGCTWRSFREELDDPRAHVFRQSGDVWLVHHADMGSDDADDLGLRREFPPNSAYLRNVEEREHAWPRRPLHRRRISGREIGEHRGVKPVDEQPVERQGTGKYP